MKGAGPTAPGRGVPGPRGRAILVPLILGVLLLHASAAEADPAATRQDSIFGRPVERGGLHFQVAFGLGGGPDTVGVFHQMELGWTLDSSITVGLIHSFIQNDGVFANLGGPDLFGGWMLEVKVPVVFQDLVYKIAAGPGGTHDQSDGIRAIWGVSWLYGFDLHFPLFRGSGPTLSLVALHAVVERAHHFGISFGLGYTFF